MNIISEKSRLVNRSELAKKWTNYKEMSVKMADRVYYDIGDESRGDRMAVCGRNIVYKYCRDCGNVEIVHTRLCRDRLCPICAWRLALKRYAEMTQVVHYIYEKYNISAYNAYFLTFTVPNCPTNMLTAVLSHMSKVWTTITKRRYFGKHIIGWAKHVEITFNTTTRTMHPHYHLIVIADEEPNELIEMWLQYVTTATSSAQDSRCIVPMDEPNESIVGAILETFKYSTKMSTLLDDLTARELYDYDRAVCGKRMTAYGGIIKQIRKELCLTDEENLGESEGTEDTSRTLCAKCLSPQVELAIAQWSYSKHDYIVIEREVMSANGESIE